MKSYFVAVGTVVLALILFSTAPPFSYPRGAIITIQDGDGLYELAEKLENEHVIRSSFWFRTLAILMGGERDMKAGEYLLEKPQNVSIIAWRILHGFHGIETVKLTIPEGFNVEKIATLFDNRFPNFNQEEFKILAPEGYLFPDTYFVPVTATASSTIKLMRDNFTYHISPGHILIDRSGKTLDEIITMASLLEGEAQTPEDRGIISGILWKRLALGIALQVDASFTYINGKTTKELTKSDLEIDSPYNTYLYRGLPPTPISNPGLESIHAALNPTDSPYLYFLTGDDGTMHYSKTFDEHKLKKQKYLSGR